MSVTFTKLFSSITESTVWCEPDRTRLVWICMLAMADRHGRVYGSIPGLANRARVPVEDARKAIETFLAPDADSRTKDSEGRRIEEMDGGWRLLNHAKYRDIRDEESILESKRKYINARRARERAEKGACRSVDTTVDSGRANAEAYTEAEAEANTTIGKITKREGRKATSLPDDWVMPQEYREFCEQERPDLNADQTGESFKDYWTGIAGDKGRKANWFGAFKNWVRKERGQTSIGLARPKASRHSGFSTMNYSEGVGDDGSF